MIVRHPFKLPCKNTKGDRLGFVILDHRCEVYSVSRRLDMKAKDLKSKLKDRKSLPSVEETKEKISQDMQAHLSSLKDKQNHLITSRLD